MTRLQNIELVHLDDAQRVVWERIMEKRGGVTGPYNVLMRLPLLADLMSALGEYFRSESLLSGADRELAILSAAQEIGSKYEWQRHEPLARQAGTRAEAIECLRTMIFNKMTQRELVIVEVVQSLFRTRSVPSHLFSKALKELGENELVELVTLTGFYCSIAFLITAFEIALPEGTESPF